VLLKLETTSPEWMDPGTDFRSPAGFGSPCRRMGDRSRSRSESVTDFLRTTVTDAANPIIRESEVLTLAERSRNIFVEALLNPPKPNRAAIAAARRFKQEVS
jgi:hypothetical protein